MPVRKRQNRSPPSPKKTEFLSIRVTPERKQALARAAITELGDEPGALSRYAETLLQRGAQAERLLRETLGPPHVRALTILVSRLAMLIERHAGERWNQNAYATAALAAGTRTLLAELGASGELKVPKKLRAARASADVAHWTDDPRALGEWEARGLADALRDAQRTLDDPESTDLAVFEDAKGVGQIVDMRDEYRFWAELANDLGVKGDEQ